MKIKDHHRRDFHAYFWFDWINRGFYPVDYSLVLQDASISTLEAFVAKESLGKDLPCKEPDLLRAVLRGKAKLNMQIKEWAQGWFDCGGRYYFEYTLKHELPWLPDWVWQAVDEQHWKYAVRL